MFQPVIVSRIGEIGIVTLSNPPHGVLDANATEALRGAFVTLAANPAVAGIVLAGAGNDFSPGPNDAPPAPPAAALAELTERIEGMAKPVLAALHGAVIGPALELAMACHWRLAAPDARMSLPGIRIGLLPEAGGAHRLARLVGPRRALDMLISAEPMDAREALATGLVDAICPGDVLSSAVSQARAVLAQALPLPRACCRAIDPQELTLSQLSALRSRITRASPGLFALPRCVDAIEAACILPPQQALDRHALLAAACRTHSQSDALAHALGAERKAGTAPALPYGAAMPAIGSVVLLGDIAVRMAERLREAGIAVLNDDQVADADFVYASGRVDPVALRQAAGPGVIIATTDPTVPEGMSIGLRIGAMAEVVQGLRTPDAAAAAVMAMLQSAGWLPVLVRQPGSFVANVLNDAWRRAMAELVRSGVSPDRILQACASVGFIARPVPMRPTAPGETAAPRHVADEDVLDACVAAIGEEGARLVGAGVVRSQADVDVVAIHGLGFPRHRGGPMYWRQRQSTGAR